MSAQNNIKAKYRKTVLLTGFEKKRLKQIGDQFATGTEFADFAKISYQNLRNAMRIGSTSEATAKEIRAFLKSKKANQVLKPEIV